MNPRTTARVAIAAGLSVFVAGGLAAQFPPKDGRQQAQEELLRKRFQENADRKRQIRDLTFPYNAMPKNAPLPFHLGYRAGLQQLFPSYEGLPTYPSNVPGYGGYPGAGKTPDEIEPRRIPTLQKPPAEKGRWPSWIEGGTGDAEMRATAQQAVLVRITDRVWFRTPDEAAFIPLEFHDRFRFMTVGSQVDVRGKGEFQLVMHAGGNLRSRGPCAIAVTGMNEKELALRLTDVNQMWIQAGLRPFHLNMPDGTEVEFTDTLLHIERSGDRCRLANLGNSPIRFSGTFGKGELDGPQAIDLWMRPPAQRPLGNQLDARGDTATTILDGVTTIKGGTNGKVVWSGASFQVPGGSTLEIAPLKPVGSPK